MTATETRVEAEAVVVADSTVDSADRPRAALLMSPPTLAEHLFGSTGLGETVEVHGDVVTTLEDAALTELADVEVLVTGWGAPFLDADHLAALPRLRLLVHAGGTVRAVADAEVLRARGIACSNAGESNAVPVAEYTLAMILLAGTRAWQSEALYRQRRGFVDREIELLDSGNYRRTVGIVGASRIGRRVIELLRATDLAVLLHDPYVSEQEARDLGVELVTLAEAARRSDVLSLHQPWTAETTEMIDAAVLAELRPGATLINTARGGVVDQDALVERLRKGDLTAVLDVTTPDPLPPEHPLWDLPNVVLTPHIAGATGSELRRLGRHVVDEVARFVRGEPLRFREL